MKFTFTVAQTDIDKAYAIIVDQAVKTTQIRGFRKGNAPKQQVIDKIGESKLQQQAIETVLPVAYTKEIKSRGLNPVGYPKIDLKSGGKGKDFTFEAEIAEKPIVKLNDYKQALKGLLATQKIWTPDKKEDHSHDHAHGHDHDHPDHTSEDRQLQSIFEKLLEIVELEAPEVLVEQEVNRQLSRLIDQTNRLGVSLQDYLTSTGNTQESLRQQYSQNATVNLKMEFILQAIAEDADIKISDAEITNFIKSVGDEKLQQKLQTSEEINNIHYMLLKRKTVQHLLQLAA